MVNLPFSQFKRFTVRGIILQSSLREEEEECIAEQLM